MTYSFPQLTKLYKIKKSEYKPRTKLIQELQGKKVKVIFPKKCRSSVVEKKIKELCKENKQSYQTVLNNNLINIDGKPRKLTKVLCQHFDERTVSQGLPQDNVVELEITGEYKDLLNVSNSVLYTSCLNPKGCNKRFVKCYVKDPKVFLLVQRIPGKIGFAKRSVCKIFDINQLGKQGNIEYYDHYGYPVRKSLTPDAKEKGIYVSVIYGHGKRFPQKIVVPGEFKGMKFFINGPYNNYKYIISRGKNKKNIHDAYPGLPVKPIETTYENEHQAVKIVG